MSETAAQALGQIRDIRALEPLLAVLGAVQKQLRCLGCLFQGKSKLFLDKSLVGQDRCARWDVVGILKHFDIQQVNTALKKFCKEGLVVYIDDDARIRVIVKMLLEDKGFAVFLAADGVRGLELVRLVRPDLVLLDLSLGTRYLDGQEVYRQIKAASDLQHIPILVVSASYPENVKGFGLHVDGWLSKPVNPTELLEAIERLLKGKEWE